MLIICDYQLGFCDNLNNVKKIIKENNIKIIIDPHGYDLEKYKGCDIFKPNKKELEQLSGIIIKNNSDLFNAAKKIKDIINTDLIITTLGKDGLFYYKNDKDSKIIPTSQINFIDVCGAGDTIASIISLGLIINMNISDICLIANYYASISIKKIGTSKLYFYEILDVIKKPIDLTQTYQLKN